MSASSDIRITGLNKSYGDLSVLRQVHVHLEQGGIYCLMGPSGTGKTTLLRVLLGLERADAGSIEGLSPGEASVMFQEDRLCETLSPVDNVALVMSPRTSRRALREMLEEILPADCMNRPALQLSGGMRRRVSLARAVAYPSKLIVLDEPFTGLDVETKKTVVQFLLAHRANRTLLVSTHGEDDVRLLGGKKILLSAISASDRGDYTADEYHRDTYQQEPCDRDTSKDERGTSTNDHDVSKDERDASKNGQGTSKDNQNTGTNDQDSRKDESGIRKNERKEQTMIDTTIPMRELVAAEPLFADFLVSKGFPFSVENPVTEFVTFDEVVQLRDLDKDAFLAEYAQFKAERENA